MKKIFLLFFTLLLISCFENEKEKKEVFAKNPFLNQNLVTVIIPVSLWNGKIGEKIREKFAAPIAGLHENETVFTLMPLHTNYFPSAAKVSRNILIVSTSFKTKINHTKNKYSKNQNIFAIQGNNELAILQQLETSSNEILNTFYTTELNFVLSKTNCNTQIQNNIKSKFLVSMQIPNTYSKALVGENFLWLRKNVGSGNNNLLIYTASFSALYNKNAMVTNSLNIRNLVSKTYVLGKTNGTYMIAKQAYYPFYRATKIANNVAYEMRGIWEFHNDFMTGPYLNFAIKDNKRKRFVIVDGFAYNPMHSKKELLFEMEAIIKTAKIL